MKRVSTIDIVRGIVMVIMALDHVRDLMHVDSLTASPTNLDTTTPVLFFTRWITYLCAPAFVFLAGTSAYLSFTKSTNVSATRRFLLTRGLYLVVLEFVVVNFLIFFDPGYHTLLFEVIAAIGFGFIILALLLGLPAPVVLAIGLIIICGHNGLSFITFPANGAGKVASLLFGPGAVPLSDRVFVMAYPPIPWLGIMLTGFGCGRFFSRSPEQRKNLFLTIGSVALVVFVALRYLNAYGDPAKWTSQKDAVFTFLSFINVTKYPPSAQFCFVTLGIMFLMLAAAEAGSGRAAKVVSVYGKVPLFYFLSHFLLIHLITVAMLLLQGFSPSEMDFASGRFGRPREVASGISLAAVYGLWLVVVAVLYYPCLWFGRYKGQNKHWWLKYT